MENTKTLLGNHNPRNQEDINILDPRKNPRSTKSQLETDVIADLLVDKFKSPEYRPLFLKVAWRLDRGTIDRLAATAMELGKNPRAYFITLAKRERSYHG